LKRDLVKRGHFLIFLDYIFSHGHAEVATPVKEDKEVWYIPIFGVYHLQKKDQIRVVFDSSAEQDGLFLNKVLLSGPDLTNSLLGVLLRFRQSPIAIIADIQKIFYTFFVRKEHRNYLHFFWYSDNNPEKELTEYRMCVHVFSNSSSPAAATGALRKTMCEIEETYVQDVREFVEKGFYVDDGLASVLVECVLMNRTQAGPSSGGNLRLHTLASNSDEILNAFPKEDLAKGMKELDLGSDQVSFQRSLGLG
jgi:hypothetical protein